MIIIIDSQELNINVNYKGQILKSVLKHKNKIALRVFILISIPLPLICLRKPPQCAFTGCVRGFECIPDPIFRVDSG